jgi:hypothetical protein
MRLLLVMLLAACDRTNSATHDDLSAIADLAIQGDLSGLDLANGPDLATPENGPDLSIAALFDLAPPDLTRNFDGPPTVAELLSSAPLMDYNHSETPFDTFFQSQRFQFVYLASDLTAAGIPAGAVIVALEMEPSETPARQLDSFRIALANTNVTPDPATVFPIPFYVTAPTVVYGPVDEPTSRFVPGNLIHFDLTTPFIWDGTSNFLLETSNTEAVDGVSGGGIEMRTVSRPNAWLIYATHSSVAYPFTGKQPFAGSDLLPRLRLLYK